MEEVKKEEAVIEERKKQLTNFIFKKKFILTAVGLIVLLFLAWHIRTSNVENLKDVTTGNYTLGPDLDPFLFLRYAKYIVEHGSLMENDSMRYVPLGYNTAGETRLLPYMITYFYKIINIFSTASIEYAAVIFPVFMFLLTIIAFFLFIREVFKENKYRSIIALIASLFLIVSPSLLARTVAGIPEKESVGFFFMFLAFYFFLASWKSQNIKKSLVLAFFSGLSTALMGLVWGGWIYIFTSIAVFVFVNFFVGKVDKKRFLSYSIWLFISFLVVLLFSGRFTLVDLVTSTSTGLSVIVFALILADFLIFNTKIKNIKQIENLRKKIPDKVISLIFFVILIFIFSSLIFGISFIPNFIGDILFHLTQPYSDRLSFTVAENRQPYFNEWGSDFGPIVRGIPLFFWLFFLGSIFLVYEAIKDMEKKAKIILIISYILFLLALIFSRYSNNSVMNGSTLLSKMVYFGGFLLMAFSSCYLFYKYFKENKLEEFKKINFSYLFLIVFFFVSVIGARSAIRLIMVLVPSAVGIVGFFSIYFIEKIKQNKDGKGETLMTGFFVMAGLIIIISLYCLYFNYQATLAGARGMIPSVYTQQWQKAMAWVRENTSKEAVFAHWWDYGYWLQSIGERATVLDGGNAIAYWDHLLGRHVLSGKDEKEALEFLFTHNATHLLIDSSEIGKYGAYSSIGSDENYDRYSWLGTFLLNEKAIEERKNETVYVYQGAVSLDEDYMIKQNEQQIFLAAGKSGVGAIILTISNQTNQGDNTKFKQPEAVFVYQGKQFIIPLRYLYYQEKLYDFENGYKGALYIMARAIPEGQVVRINNLGAALFFSERNMRALWIKLYLLGQGENFKLIHSEDDYVVASLKQQGFDVGDFVYYEGIRGPIKIWKINYPSDIEFKKEYLSTEYPANIEYAKQPF